MEMVTPIIVAVLASNGAFALIQFLITRHDTRTNIKDKLLLLEKDGLRTQLLLLILMKPEETSEILKVAEHYFVKLKANWYMTGLFAKWCDEHGLEPEWFKQD